MPSLLINNHKVEFQPGQTILDLCSSLSIDIPTLCYLKGTTPEGVCGICLVKEAARGMIRACDTEAVAGMDIRTDGQKVRAARRKAIEKLVAGGNHNCGVAGAMKGGFTDFQMDSGKVSSGFDLCPAWGDCRLQDLVYEYQAHAEAFTQEWKNEVPDVANPMIVRDYSRCIGCGRCVKACNEVQANMAIKMDDTGKRVKVTTTTGSDSLMDTDCVFCGECVQACPVGALVEKKAKKNWRPWDVETVRTTCPYCGVGCQQLLHVRNGKIIKVTGVEDGAPNKGRLCVKGRFGYDFIYSDERIKMPVIRQENGEFKEVSWDEALDYTADRLKAIIAESGPDAVAGVSCARSINEDSYQMQKLFRAVFKTNNIDHCART